jgi:fatty-acyl-CoA synthase
MRQQLAPTPGNAPKESSDWLRALDFTTRAVAQRERTLGRILNELAADHGERIALIGAGVDLSFADLAARANQYARWALAHGIKKGDCVALLMPNHPDYLAIWAGISQVGGMVALLNSNLRGPALAHCLDIVSPTHAIVARDRMEAYATASPTRTTRSHLWVCHGDWADTPRIDTHVARLSPAPLSSDEQPQLDLADKALYIYTSGTTGLPKAANVSHRRVIEWCYWFAGLMDTAPDDRMYNCLPMYHSVGGVVAIGSALVRGGSVVIRERFSASSFWDDVVSHECTLFQYIGELCRYLLKAPPSEKETSHRIRVCCGNGMRADVWEPFQQRFAIPRVLEFYAATEGSFSLYNVTGRVGAIGRIPGFMSQRSPVVLVARDSDTGDILRGPDGLCIPCPDGMIGEALGRLPQGQGRGDGRFEGYAGKGHDEAKLLRDVLAPGDVWFRTGDLMRRDKAGYYYFMDRTGDTFRWKGENVSTLEVANVIAACPGVAEVAVYGVALPGAEGRAGMAAIVPQKDFSLATLSDQLSALPGYARPLFLRLVDSLAMTDTFKHKKTVLIEDGFDIRRTTDPLFVSDDGYVPLTAARYARLVGAST